MPEVAEVTAAIEPNPVILDGLTVDTPPEVPVVDPKETAARTKGWRPKEEYNGDPETWVDAKEFMAREPLLSELKHRGKEIKELKKTVDAMATHFQKAVETGVQRQINNLNMQRREAISDGDVSRVEAIEAEITQVRQSVPVVPASTGLDPALQSFVERNEWFNANKDMQAFAIAYNETYLRENPGDLEKSLEKTEAAVKRAFPEAFTAKSNKEIPPAVEGGTRTETAPRYSMRNLTPEQQLCCKAFVKNGTMTEQQYIEALKEMGELK